MLLQIKAQNTHTIILQIISKIWLFYTMPTMNKSG
jgi:hypothetical protein